MRLRLNSTINYFSWLLALFIVTVSLFAQSIIVCPQCSYEVAQEARFCAHCGARIEKVGTTSDTAIPVRSDAIDSHSENGSLEPKAPATVSTTDAIALVKEDIALGASFMTASSIPNPAAALAALLNARAIIAISQPGTIDADTRAIVLKGIVTTREAISRVRTTCPRCHGKGQDDVVQDFSALNGERTPLVVGKRACPMCAGRGSILRLRKISEINSLLGTGRQMFSDEALVRERIRIGNAWVSPDCANRLTIRQQAMLRHYTADPCPECAGFGKTDCNTCDNTGFAPCTATDCNNGYIRPPPSPRANPRDQRIESMRIVTPRVCPVCKGTALTTCTQCAGTGSINCRRCNGSGERNTCSRCKGEGIQPCKVCRGTGKDRQGNDCATCSGEGVSLCTSCGGDGYGR